jgi:phage protein D
MAVMTLAKQAPDFGEFYVPRFELRAAGAALTESVIRDVTEVTYRDNIKEIDSFDVTVGNWDAQKRKFKYVGSEDDKSLTAAAPEAQLYKLFEPCARDFTLYMGYGDKLQRMTTADVTTMQPAFPSAGASTLTVRALNVLHRLRDKQNSNVWKNTKESDIAKSIKTLTDTATQRKVKVRVSDSALSTEQPIDYVAQENQYDIDFLFMRARLASYVVFVGEETSNSGTQEYLYFGPSDDKHAGLRDVTYELECGLSLTDFNPTLSVANQVKSVEVRSRDRQSSKVISAKVTIDDPAIKANSDLVPLLSQPNFPVREEVVVNEPQPNKERARRRALAILSDRLKQMVTATGSCIGLPDLRAGQHVRIKGVGARFSGLYFVTETTHTINDQGYTTKFTASREKKIEG